MRMMQPEKNRSYTRMLLFVLLAIIPMVFLIGFVGWRDHRPFLIEHGRAIAETAVPACPLAMPVWFFIMG